jgi:hypothetical protein
MTDTPVRVTAAPSLVPRERDARGKLLPRAKPVVEAVQTEEPEEINNGEKRIPLGQHVAKLSYAARPGFVRRWISDVPGRVERALGAGWSHVKDLKDKTPVRMVTDPSLSMSGRQGFLMELPQALYEEDQKVKQDSLDEVDEHIYKGTFNQEANDKRYNPTFAPNKFEVRRGSGKV